MTIRKLAPEESKESKESFKQAYLRIWNHSENLKYLSFTGIAYDSAQLDGWLESHERQNQPNHIEYLYHREDNTTKGIIVVSISSIEGFEILGLGVDPAAKRNGIGSRLLAAALEMAVSASYRSVQTSVFADNASMQRLILKGGFMPVAIENSRRFDGMSLVKYQKILGGDP